MRSGYLTCLCALSLLWGVSLAGEGDVSAQNSPATARLHAAIQHASELPESPYFLQVNCTDQKGIRSFELFPGGATIWKRRSQIMLPPSARSNLLETLADRNFTGFESRYGGREQPAKSAAPARVTCRIRIEIQNLEKSSVQMTGGEQSAQLLNLAAELLDHAEQYIESAVTPVDLQDALDKLGNGQLAPQVLSLRFMELPRRDSSNPGFILRLGGGRLSYQAYSPGQPPAALAVKPLEQDQFVRLIAAMRTEQLASLPTNLWSESQMELEVQVLAHKKVVLARRFSRLESAKQDPAQQHFEKFIFELRELAQAIGK
ncbi:MAG: hypothetical protein WBN06_08760 [Lysobacterales bacterium]